MRASLVPDLLIEARRVVNTVIAGWHGRRKRGIGENFWQFRPYVEGEAIARIDWRRSARDDHTYVRDREWEAAHTVWLWADPSPSMLYKSARRDGLRRNRARWCLSWRLPNCCRAAASASPGRASPIRSRRRNGAERLASHLVHAGELPARPDLSAIRRFSDIVIAGDFLDPVEETMAWLDVLQRHGVRAHLIEVADPAEETFPYSGRTEFSDPETGEKLTAGRAETVSATTTATPIWRGGTSSPPAASGSAGAIPSTTPTGWLPKRWSRVHFALSADGFSAAGLRA